MHFLWNEHSQFTYKRQWLYSIVFPIFSHASPLYAGCSRPIQSPLPAVDRDVNRSIMEWPREQKDSKQQHSATICLLAFVHPFMCSCIKQHRYVSVDLERDIISFYFYFQTISNIRIIIWKFMMWDKIDKNR